MLHPATTHVTLRFVVIALIFAPPLSADTPELSPEAPPMVVFRPLSAEELAEVAKPELRGELLRLAAEDQQARLVGGCGDPGADVEEAAANVDAVDIANTARMQELVAEHGWPTVAVVGSDGARAAWLLVQHADHDLEWQRQCLEWMTSHAEEGQADPIDLAYLTDRVRVNEGREQWYGTQFFWVDGKREPHPIEAPEQVDDRRESLGMRTLRAYSKFVNT